MVKGSQPKDAASNPGGILAMFALLGSSGGYTCYVCIVGCGCHGFGLKSHLKAIFLGLKFAMWTSCFLEVKVFSNCNFSSVQFSNTLKIFPCHQMYG